MSKFHDRAVACRTTEAVHYNCAQATVIPFVKEVGLNEDMVNAIAANFGQGMKRAATCGAVSGGLMVLGMYGVSDPKIIKLYYDKIREKHEGYLDCANLLRLNKEQGGEKKPHCDSMVYECVEIAENILKEQGKL